MTSPFDHLNADALASIAMPGAVPQDMPPMLARRLAVEHGSADGGSPPLSRRHFLKLGVGGGFALGLMPVLAAEEKAADTGAKPAAAQASGAAGGAPAAAGLKPFEQPSAFVRIDAEGIVTVVINRLDFGQGVQTGLPLILAEELDADWSKVRSTHGSNAPAYADPLFGMHLTGGSTAIKNSYAQYRELGARARAMLVAAAAERWNAPAASLSTAEGFVVAPDGRRAGYGELAEAAMRQPVPEKVTLKDPARFRLIGKPTGRLDAAAKSSGRQAYGIDTRLPGMLTAVVAHPPVFGAKLLSLDDSAAKAVAGVKAVLRIAGDRGADAVAIVAEGYWPAKMGRDALKLQWDLANVEKVDSQAQLAQYRELAKQPGPRRFKADVAAIDGAAKRIDAEFVFPYLAHASMEPLNCTLQWQDDRAELWVGTQMPGIETMAAAKELGLAPNQIAVHVQMAGGGFGRRGTPSSDVVIETCRIAKAMRGAGLRQPVRLVWSREDDMKGGYYRPMHLHTARIGLDADGKLLGWDHVIVGQSILAGTFFEARMVRNGVDMTMIEGMKEPYDLPLNLTTHHPKVNVPVLWWRSVGSTHTAFVMETLIDEIASAQGKDPVAWRLAQFGDAHPRHRDALKLAVEASGYGKRELPAGRAWGVAVHESFSTVVAIIAEASVVNGQPVLHKATAGVHCNRAVNPKSVEAQIQGAMLMGLSMCLPGVAITLKDGQVEQGNFDTYQVPRITAMPEVAVHIVPSTEPPTGIGEPGLPPLAPAFANAIAKATGKRLRVLPFSLA